MPDVRQKGGSEVEVSISRSGFSGSRPASRIPRFRRSLVFLLVFFGSSAFAGEMRLPSPPNLPSGEKTYDAGGAAPDQPEELESVSRPAGVQGEVKPDTEGVKTNKYKIDYTQKSKRIGNSIYDKNKGNKREELENSEQIPGQPTTNPPSVERRSGFDYQAPQLGRIGFDFVDKRKGSIHNEEMVPQF